ncbi:ABC transporter ATP-binding protein [Rhodobacteraceae bacterium NNCM2]|nr:ABC transporter ATP-binding protein [Coraliihabitans acroporae]
MTTGKDKPIIQLDRVEKSFGSVKALDGVTAEIRTGEFFSLLGPSGCGKTTLLRMIAGFDDPTSGMISIDGRPMVGVAANHRPTNMVFQSYAIFPHLNVAENVAYGLKKQRLGRQEEERLVAEALEMVDLAGYQKRASHAMSGGQRQRVALARALVMRPKVLLLDEPLSALDKKLREQMQTELRHLQRQVGITFILVTHDQEEALTMSDRIAVMFDGQIAQLSTPQELYQRPVSRRVASFIGLMNFLDVSVDGEAGETLSLDVAALGRVEIPRSQAPGGVNGAQPSVGIRPEMMTVLLEDSDRAEREVSARIVDVSYYGDMTYYEALLPDVEKPVTVTMRNTAGRRILAEGDTARIGWSPDSVVLLA